MTWLAANLVLAAAAMAAGDTGQNEVRVALVAFEDFRGAFEQSQRLLEDLAKSDPSLRFRLAAGTYGDVRHWLNRGFVDIAVVTPGMYAEMLSADGPSPHGAPAVRWLATVGRPAALPEWSQSDRRKAGYFDYYRAVCVTRADSSLKSLDDLRLGALAGRIRWLCVHPTSVSSRIAPAFALARRGLTLEPAKIEYTHSHTSSLRLLAAGGADSGSGERVAFVWDDALRLAPELADQLRQIPFPELEQLEIPSEAVVARADFELADRIQELLRDHVDAGQQHDFVVADAGAERYAAVGRWRAAINIESDESQNVSLEEIGRLLVHHARSQPRPPRLAVVLSGGGAKCAYQVGVVAALEEQLEKVHAANPDCACDIDLVVGTSGGAINALPIALGITRTPEGRRDFLETWAKLDQRMIVRPSWVVRGNIGLWFVLVQVAAVLWLLRRIVGRREIAGWIVGVVFTGLAAVELLLRYVNLTPWSWLGTNHWLHHAWLWMSFGIGVSAWCLLGLGVVAFLWQWRFGRGPARFSISSRRAAWGLAAGLFGLPLAQIVTVLFFQQTLSGAEGIERALATHFPPLINRRSEASGALPVQPFADAGSTLQAVSREVHTQKLLSRDLVLTGSCLEQSTAALPDDLYFYAASRAGSLPAPFGVRGIDLASHRALLLDVVLGSGSIFPVFPARRLNDFPARGEFVDLVDGGFSHNSPIEAAVLWGATHVVLIEASPRERAGRANFLQNAGASFDHLYEQSQVLDARSRGKVAVFTLAPEPPHLCVLDFADNLIRAAADRGYRDAAGGGTAGPSAGATARFRKEPGEPIFSEVAPPSER
ncbi:MAG: patatin-like phospholipase family protein [Planctomycetaceae bacterium]